MLTALGLFVKQKLFSTTGIFLLIFASIFTIFLFYNSNIIFSKLGFETTTNLKAELTRVEGELETLSRINSNLIETVVTLQNENKINTEILEKYNSEREKIKDKITTTKNQKNLKSREATLKVTEKTIITDKTITIPTSEYNKLSEENIGLIHDVFSLMSDDEILTTS